MAGSIYAVLEWAKQEGDVKAIDRIRVRVLPHAMKEGLVLCEVQATTTCSPELLTRFREVASKVVGKECPV